jgi:hypothetical protein
LEKGEKWNVQPHVDPSDPSRHLVPTSAEPDCVVHANVKCPAANTQTDLKCPNWATQLPDVLSKMNSGMEDLLMPNCAHIAHDNVLNFVEDCNPEHEV